MQGHDRCHDRQGPEAQSLISYIDQAGGGRAGGAIESSDEEEAPRKGAAKAGKGRGRGKGKKDAGKRGRNIFIDDAAEEDDDVSRLHFGCIHESSHPLHA